MDQLRKQPLEVILSSKNAVIEQLQVQIRQLLESQEAYRKRIETGEFSNNVSKDDHSFCAEGADERIEALT